MIKQAVFFKSCSRVNQCPSGNRDEFAFIGRSNVGKSTLINLLCNRKKLAKTSSTPGKTQLINYFLINENWFLVDLPGYGFARTPGRVREGMGRLVTQYILNRANLVNLFMLIDVRHAPQKIDLEFITWLGESRIPFSLVFTKSDKLSSGQLEKNLRDYESLLLETWEELPKIFIVSALQKRGTDQILDYIDSILHREKE